MSKHCYQELVQGYQLDKKINVKETKTAVVLNLFALLVMALSLIPFFHFQQMEVLELIFPFHILLGVLLSLVVVIIHELIHGLFFKIFSRSRLTFGLTLAAAYCGTPNIYYKRWPYLVIALMPFIVLSSGLLALTFIFPSYATVFYFAFAIHLGGCVGDLYVAFLLLFKYDNNVLCNDLGYEMQFYMPISE